MTILSPARRLSLLLLAWISAQLVPPPVRAAKLELIPAGAEWRYQPGSREASLPDSTAWRLPAFDDAGWDSGPLPIFYGEPLTGTLLTGMQGNFTTVFLRRRFQVESPARFQTGYLVARCDDGFVAWINGRRVATYNVAEDIATNPNLGSTALGAVTEPVDDQEFTLTDFSAALQPGENVLTVMVFNANLGSSDLVFDASLIGQEDETPPTLVARFPDAGETVRELSTVEVEFSEPVDGVTAGDLTANGVVATEVRAVSPTQFVFTLGRPPAGNVALRFVADHGITDRSPGRLPFSGAAWTVTIDPVIRTGGPQLNEFLASNQRGLRDDDGDREDWIEIYNSASQPVSLTGWRLTDSATQLTKWTFPPVSLPARGYLLVWASGKNRTNAAAPLHTNFRLGRDGQYLALVSPAGEIVNALAPQYPAQRPDVSYGLGPGSFNTYVYFPTPTPRALNVSGGPGFAPDVEFSVSGGTYTSVLEVSLSLATNTPATTNALIRYTLNDSLPDERSAIYAGPLRFTNVVARVRARAFAPEVFPGAPRTEVYIPLSASVAAFRSDLPVLLIHDFNRGRPPSTTRIPAVIQEFQPGTNGITSLTNPPVRSHRAGISVRGSSTEGQSKMNLRVEFQDEFGNDQDVPLMGLPADGDWILYAPNSFEPVMTHNPFMHQLSRDIGRYSPRTRFCEVYLAINGTNAVATGSYYGIYVLQERIEIGQDRVDAGSLGPENLTAPTLTGGYLLKRDRTDPGDSGFFAGGESLNFVDPREAELELLERRPQRDYIVNYIENFGNALNSPAFANPVSGYRAWIDVPSWIDHHLLNVFAFNVDSLRLSTFLYKPRNGRLAFGPLWDFDRALGSTDGRDERPRVWRGLVADRGTDYFGFETQAWWGRLFQDPDFFQEWIDRFQELRLTHLSTSNLWRLQDQLSDQIRQAQPRETQRWGSGFRGGSYNAEIGYTKRWMSNRVDFMQREFVWPPRFDGAQRRVERGAAVALTAPADAPGSTNYVIYVTTDGSDPRLPGGAISPRARPYGDPLVINRNTRVIARSFNPSPVQKVGGDNPPLRSNWSGPTAATFVTDPSPLVISEIHFNPPAPGVEDGDDFEFLEIYNPGSQSVSLQGYTLRGGIDFAFAGTNLLTAVPPGGHVVVVANRALFLSRYPGASSVIAGQYVGRLANDGDHIVLVGPLEEIVCDFRYDDTWEAFADGAGYSLVLADEGIPAADLGWATSWRASAKAQGSPGASDEASQTGPFRLALSPPNQGLMTLRFTALTGRPYVIETTFDLTSPVWLPLQTNPPAAQRIVEWPVPTGEAQRFLRVRNQP